MTLASENLAKRRTSFGFLSDASLQTEAVCKYERSMSLESVQSTMMFFDVPIFTEYKKYASRPGYIKSLFRDYLAYAQKFLCCLCKKQNPIYTGFWVLHHDHTTGKIVGVAHQSCNTREGRGAHP